MNDLSAALHDWAVARCDADPFFNQQMLASEDPYEAAYRAWQSEQVASTESYPMWRLAKPMGRSWPSS